eukprot:SAG25_NODE_582_length_6759_cov_2.468919_1_plen_95_part_00
MVSMESCEKFACDYIRRFPLRFLYVYAVYRPISCIGGPSCTYGAGADPYSCMLILKTPYSTYYTGLSGPLTQSLYLKKRASSHRPTIELVLYQP